MKLHKSFALAIGLALIGCGGSGGSTGGGGGNVITPEEPANVVITPGTPQSPGTGGSVTFSETPVSGGQFLGWTLDNANVTSSGTMADGTIVTVARTTISFSNISGSHTVGESSGSGVPPPP